MFFKLPIPTDFSLILQYVAFEGGSLKKIQETIKLCSFTNIWLPYIILNVIYS